MGPLKGCWRGGLDVLLGARPALPSSADRQAHPPSLIQPRTPPPTLSQAVEEAAAAGSQFDVVLMDMCMPVLGGVEATQVRAGLCAEPAVCRRCCHCGRVLNC